MKLQSLQAAISSRFPSCTCVCGNGGAEIGAVLLGGGQPEIKNAVRMYAGPVPEDGPGLGPEDCCLCLASCAPPAVNRIMAADREELAAIFNRLQACLAQAQALGGLTPLAATGRLGLQEIVDRATEILDNPLLVADPGFRIIAISGVEWEDSAWKNFQKLRKVPYHPDMVQKHEQFRQEIQRGRYISLVDGKHKNGFFIRCAVMQGDSFLAQMHIFSAFHEFSAVDLELAGLLAGVVGVALAQSVSDRSRGSTTSDYLISDLISGKLADAESIRQRLAYVGWSMDRVKYLLLVYWDGDEENVNFRDACITSLCRVFPDGRCAADGPYMAVIFSTDEELNIESPALEQVSRQLERTKQRGVLSLPFEELTDAAYRYRQTREILDLNRRLDRREPFLLAEACATELMISQAGVKYRLMDYCHPLIRRLMEHDISAGKDHVETLRAYLETGRSFTKAAERLHMHRNSVIYRMKQIEDYLGCDFSRETYSFQFQLSFRILDYIRREEAAPR